MVSEGMKEGSERTRGRDRAAREGTYREGRKRKGPKGGRSTGKRGRKTADGTEVGARRSTKEEIRKVGGVMGRA